MHQNPEKSTKMSGGGEIVIVPFPHPGHIFPAAELSRQLADRNHNVTILLPSSSTSLSPHPRIQIIQFPLPHPTRFPPAVLEQTLPDLLIHHLQSNSNSNSNSPVCIIVDEMISWLLDVCAKFDVPAAALFTSSASCEAAELAAAKSNLPLRRHGGRHGGPHGGRRRPRGMAGTTGAAALLVNTCDELERPALDSMAAAAAAGGVRVWGVGPLLPAKFWAGGAAGGGRTGPNSSVTEGEVLTWLDARPARSVIYVSFGTLVAPTDEELSELAAGLAASGRFFIWVVQAETTGHDSAGEPVWSNDQGFSFSPDALAKQTAGRGLVIHGWAPQLLILGHVATGAFVCHCGWNSTVEALASGVPVLTWPVRGDQFHNARLVTDRLGTGCAVRGGDGETVTSADVARGIEKVLTDGEIRRRAAAAREIFAGGFPQSSAAALDAFVDFVTADGRRKN